MSFVGSRAARAPTRDALAPVLGATVAAGAAALAAALLAALGAPAAAFLALAPLALGPVLWPATAAFALLFFLLQKQGFVFHWRAESTKVSLDEIALFLGVLALPPAHVVLGVAASSLASQVVHRRAAYKAAFNVAQYALAATGAAGVALAMRSWGVPSPWFALASPLVFSVTTSLLVSFLFGRMEGEPALRVFRARFMPFSAMSATLGASLGLGVVALASLSPWATLAAVPVFLHVRRFGRLAEWADAELRTHQRLAAMSAEVAGSADLDSVATRILAACREILDAGEVRLLLSGAQGPREWREGPGSASGSVAALVQDARGQAIGSLSAGPKRGQRAFGERERHLLQTVAASVASASANASALRAAEAANRSLSESESRYRTLFETSRLQLHVLDREGRILDLNPAAARMLGLPQEEAVGRALPELLPDAAGVLRGALEAGFARGEAHDVECASRGQHFLLDARALPGEPARLVVFARDVTPLKALEAELRESNRVQHETIRRLENMNRELEEFTLWTTHDMREPLRSIGTIAGLLHEDLDRGISPEEARDMTRRICEGSERLKERVKALHAFSLIVQRDDAFGNVDLQEVVDVVVDSMEAKVRERRAQVVLPRGRFPIVRAQPHRIHQVVANLVENALKYGHAQEPRVEIGHEETPEGLRLFVRDNGPGIPAQYHHRIFQLFQRGPATQEPGSGAGLAIVKRIVEQHGGRVWVESEAGQGACFYVLLPSETARKPFEGAEGSPARP